MTMLWNRAELVSWRKTLQKEGLRLVFTNGCFDLLHVGHVRLLERAASLGDRLLVALNSDESVRRLKGTERPFTLLEERAEIVTALRSVDRITAFGEDTPYELIKLVRPDVLVKGGDWLPDEVVGKDIVEADGGVVEIIPLVPGRSTSELIRKIRAQRDDLLTM
jgi:D-beta-D-heptose 7-phosphate kinase/D-beta-D-heptose 1-phosphate adenosyltransferase